ncbi:MAG TPA: DEAD/DEAH box helicase [Polyangiaceae bacterium]
MSDLQSSTPPVQPTLDTPELALAVGPVLVQALVAKGFQALTRVQQQVLEPGLGDRDLRISSQTGSGKTVAIGLVLRNAVAAAEPPASGVAPERRGQPKSAAPRAIIVVPTRELAAQVQVELSWLYRGLQIKVASVTGGASYRDEHRALARGPAVVVGTPGRLLDHLTRGVIDATGVAAVVLDEADQMLDLGFKDDLDAIFEHLPEQRRTHLVSATFAREVMALADRVQTAPVHIEGTPLGSANTDIDHVVHVIEPSQRVDALVNVLLHHPEDQTLVFARTRADVADITRELQAAGFAAGALSGEMDQAARNAALAAFKRGQLRALVATDVAARGIDVQNIARVVQIDAPPNADSYTHRSGRTGRAGRKGTSLLLISRAALRRTEQLLARARVKARVEPVPTADMIRAAQDERMLNELSAPVAEAVSDRVQRQVARIVESGHTEIALARLVTQLQRALGEAREIRKIAVAPVRDREPRGRDAGPRGVPHEGRGAARRERPDAVGWVSFRVTCGRAHGADPRRLVAMLCRRGRINGSDIGAIRVSTTYSDVEVAQDVAGTFAEATQRTDPRNPRVNVHLLTEGGAPPRPKPAFAKPFRGAMERPRPAPGGKRPGKKKKRAPAHAAVS